jgi:hypothetical protein
MKRNRKEQKFLDQLKTIPNISLACEKVGLSRNTVYRWCKEDPTFQESLDEALSTGTESVNDLAESKLIANINKGDMRAIQYWLDNNKKNYIRPRPKDLWDRPMPVTDITITVVDPEKKLKEVTAKQNS